MFTKNKFNQRGNNPFLKKKVIFRNNLNIIYTNRVCIPIFCKI